MSRRLVKQILLMNHKICLFYFSSPSDSLSETRSKMVEYIENGAQLGWLIHSKAKQVFIYRPNQEVEILENPDKVSGESLLTGFELDLSEIW